MNEVNACSLSQMPQQITPTIPLSYFYIPHEEINFTHFLEKLQKHAPSFRLLKTLMLDGVVDFYGNVNPNYHSPADETLKIFNQNMFQFLNSPKFLKMKGVDIEIEISLSELFNYLAQVEPAITIEILKKNSLFFLGYEGINEIFKSWGYNLSKICGHEYINKLKEEIGNPSFHFFIQYYVEQSNPEIIAKLKRAVLEYIASKTPIQTTDDNYLEQRQKILQALYNKEESHYSDWLGDDFDPLDNFIKIIAADELVATAHKELSWNSTEPFSGLTLEFTSGEKIEMEFSRVIRQKNLRFADNKIHFPLACHLSSKDFKNYDCCLIQGVIDILCGIKTPVPFDFIRLKDGIEFLKGVISGQTYRTSGLQSSIVSKILGVALEKTKKNPKGSLGKLLTPFITKVWKKAVSENISCKTYPSHAALIVTAAACELLADSIPLADLREIIKAMSVQWKDITERKEGESPFFAALATALNSGIPYPLISIFMRISAIAINQEEKVAGHTRAWQNECGWENRTPSPNQIEEIVQLELKKESFSFFLSFPKRPLDSILKLLEYPLECRKYMPQLLEIFQENPNDEIQSLFSNVSIPNLENYIPQLLKHLYHLLKQNSILNKRISLIDQFFLILGSKSSLFSAFEKDQFEKIRREAETTKINQANLLIEPILKFFGASQNHNLNHAAFELFKTLENSPLKISLAKALCNGAIPHAVHVFIRMAKDQFDLSNQCELLEILCTSLKKLPSKSSVFYLDMISAEIKKLFSLNWNIPSKDWLTEQLILSGHPLSDHNEMEALGSFASNALAKSLSSKADLLEQVKKISTHPKGFSFYQLSRIAGDENYQGLFRDHPDEFWEQILFPALENALSKPLEQTYVLYATCLNALSQIAPKANHCLQFLKILHRALHDLPLTYPFPRTLKTAIQNQLPLLFKILKIGPSYELIVSLAHCFYFHKIDIKEHLASILKSINCLLKDSNHVVMIGELLNDSYLKGGWEKSPKKLLADVYKKLSLHHLSKSFNLAFAYFQKAVELENIQDVLFFTEIMDACGINNKYKEFFQLTKKIPLDNSLFLEAWQKNFIQLFLSNADEELHERQLLCLNELIHLPTFFSLLREVTQETQLLNKLLEVKTHSIGFYKAIECALPIIEFCNVENCSIMNFYELLKFFSNISLKEKAWNILISNRSLSENEKNQCVMSILHSIKDYKSKIFTDILENPAIFSIFNLNAPFALEAYKILFEGASNSWEDYGNKKNLTFLKKAFQIVQKSAKFKEFGPEREAIQLAFANCLTQSSALKDGSKAFSLLTAILKEHFEKKDAIWSAHLRESFKRIVVHPSINKSQLNQFVISLFLYPDHDLGCFLINVFNKNPSDEDFKQIGYLLRTMILTLKNLNPLQFSNFKNFCHHLNVKKLFDGMTTFLNPESNLLAVECLNLDFIKKLIDEEKIFEIKLKAYLNVSESFAKTNMYNREVIDDILELIPQMKKRKKTAELETLFKLNCHSMICGYASFVAIEDFICLCNSFNNLLNMWSINKSLSHKLKEEIFDINEFFYIFVKVIIESYYNIPMGKKFAPIFLILESILKKGFRNPANHNQKYLELTLSCSFIFDKLLIDCQNNDPALFKEFPGVEILRNFSNLNLRFLKSLVKERKELSIFEKPFEYYTQIFSKKEEPKISETKHIYKAFNHELIIAISNLLKVENSQIVYQLSIKLISFYINDLLASFQYLVKLLRNLSCYATKIDSILQGSYFVSIAELYRSIFAHVRFPEGNKGKPYNLLVQGSLENYKRYVSMFNRQNLMTNQDQLLILNFAPITFLHKNVLEKNFQIYENCLENYLKMCIHFLPNYIIDKSTFGKLAQSFLDGLLIFSAPPKHFLKKRIEMFNHFIQALLKMGIDNNQRGVVDKVIERLKEAVGVHGKLNKSLEHAEKIREIKGN